MEKKRSGFLVCTIRISQMISLEYVGIQWVSQCGITIFPQQEVSRIFVQKQLHIDLHCDLKNERRIL